MLEVGQVIGSPGWYHLLVGALSIIRSFPCSWTIYMGPFVVPPVQHWCAKPHLPALANWTEQQWREAAIPPLTTERGPWNRSRSDAHDSCHSYMLREVHPNGSVDFDEATRIPCESWAYAEQSSRHSSAVQEVRAAL
ncbi:hypothetical protein HPB48_012305 [Haemaphysalis longicornis]|uniref:Uncharacterized protein n=1 Tax=Haemaphysalis longicornis TaxID=44386 RepID=A0A9J6FBV4_HAELO|nr:hypothetical protein HPB48_012305 [Haemaphysalis longicornis]